MTAAVSISESAEERARRFVTFHLGGGELGLPLERVREIIRVPELVRVPLAPPALLGLANLRGAVLPVVDLRRAFALEASSRAESQRVVVVDCGFRAGLLVDRMSTVLSVEPGEVESADGLSDVGGSDLVEEVVRRADDARVLVFDPRRALQGALPPAPSGREGPVGRVDGGGDDPASGPAEAQDVERLVSFVVEDQEYGLPVERVREIVTLPPRVSELPQAPPAVLGWMVLRDRNLPLLDLRRLLGLAPSPKGAARRVIVTTGWGQAGFELGLVVDRVREVLRVEPAAVEEVPPLLRGADAELSAVCRLDGGERVVTVLALDELVDVEAVAAEKPGEEERMRNSRAGSGPRAHDEDEQHVIFRLGSEAYGLPVEAVREIVRLPERVTAVPKAPPAVEGIINLRGQVLPVVDARARFGLPREARSDRQRIVVLEQGIGFVVDAVTEVGKLPGQSIGPAPNLSTEQAELIERVANLGPERGMVLLLEPERMLAGLSPTALCDPGAAADGRRA